ncbi:hypothetical protein QTP86_030596 [Hemibagrus guttatus]|nr:hypothetical protein QTP86_030596 [Hemibagrus guttatus]
MHSKRPPSALPRVIDSTGFFLLPQYRLHGAPAAFQRLMDIVLKPQLPFAAAYLDDMIIHSSTWSNHLHHLGDVYPRPNTKKQPPSQTFQKKANPDRVWWTIEAEIGFQRPKAALTSNPVL